MCIQPPIDGHKPHEKIGEWNRHSDLNIFPVVRNVIPQIPNQLNKSPFLTFNPDSSPSPDTSQAVVKGMKVRPETIYTSQENIPGKSGLTQVLWVNRIQTNGNEIWQGFPIVPCPSSETHVQIEDGSMRGITVETGHPLNRLGAPLKKTICTIGNASIQTIRSAQGLHVPMFGRQNISTMAQALEAL